MTDTADRIARLRGLESAGMVCAPIRVVVALCDDYERLAARCTLTDKETEAVRRHADNYFVTGHVETVLRRLLGEAQ